MHMVGFIIKKFVTMHSHMNVKFNRLIYCNVALFMSLSHTRTAEV